MNTISKKFGRTLSALLICILLLTSAVFVTACGDDGNLRGTQSAYVVFDDVSQDDWFSRYVTMGLRFGIIHGVSDNGSLRFEPDRSVTRAEFITMLGRLHEYGNETIGSPDDETFYESYLNWAMENGIIHGNEYGDLMPESFITREQMAVIVYRYITIFDLWGYVKYGGFTTTAVFGDFHGTSYWARIAIEYLRTNRLAFGIRGNSFRPHDTATRAETLATLAATALRLY